MEFNKIYNQDCFDTMRDLVSDNKNVDIILTSPPYCTPNDDARMYNERRFNNYQVHYDVFNGFESTEQYREWSVQLFKWYDKVLAKNGVVLYNISYTTSNPELVYFVLYDIMTNTNFTIVDCLSWKKNSALPQNMNPNRATRVCEFVFVFCRASETQTFFANKTKVGVKYKDLFTNFIEAPNNDILDSSVNSLNSATFSTGLVLQLLSRYAKKDSIVYDSFMGTGTTAVACKQFGCSYIGSELSSAQIALANKRLTNTLFEEKSVDQQNLF